MAHRTGHLKMKKEERAKQFASFKALDGFEEAVLDSLKLVAEEKVLSEEEKEELDRALMAVKVGDMVSVHYFDGEQYRKKDGMLTRVDRDARILKVVDVKIEFENLLGLKIK